MPEEPKIEMTRADLDALQGELDERISRRPRIINDIATARAHGDLSENAEYHAAREEQGQNEAHIVKLTAQIESAVVIEVVDDGIIAPGKLITFRYEGDEPETYLLGQRVGKGGDYDVLSPESPLGRALIGHAAGETVVAKVHEHEHKLEIVEVKAL
ncbi:MAG: transcription elongation factor GreA [Actinomycetota bacterium]|jgi:transcription elongation factor GreA|nr:transcription elongation factor GreA [Actinomycetota bacterium]